MDHWPNWVNGHFIETITVIFKKTYASKAIQEKLYLLSVGFP